MEKEKLVVVGLPIKFKHINFPFSVFPNCVQ